MILILCIKVSSLKMLIIITDPDETRLTCDVDETGNLSRIIYRPPALVEAALFEGCRDQALFGSDAPLAVEILGVYYQAWVPYSPHFSRDRCFNLKIKCIRDGKSFRHTVELLCPSINLVLS